MKVVRLQVYIINTIIYCLVTTIVSAEDTEQKETGDEKEGKILGFTSATTTTTDPPALSFDATYTTRKCNCKCGERNDVTRIVGGQETQANQFPWMVRLSYFNRFYCGGTLINDRYVLTAAHCIRGFMWFMIKVTLGEHNRCDHSIKPESRFVIRAFSGDFSYLNFNHDIALLRLNDHVPLNDVIRPICLPNSYSDLYVGRTATAAGWGTLEENGTPSCVLQEVQVPVMSNDECKRTSYNDRLITNEMVCAGYNEGTKDSCQGDSGGPLAVVREDKKYEQIGVVSWGNGCARPGYPGVYTRVTKYLNWIRENTKDGCFCDQ